MINILRDNILLEERYISYLFFFFYIYCSLDIFCTLIYRWFEILYNVWFYIVNCVYDYKRENYDDIVVNNCLFIVLWSIE